MVVSSAVVLTFNETAMHAEAIASNRLSMANRASHGPRVRVKKRGRNTRENPKENQKVSKEPEVRTRAEASQLAFQVLNIQNQTETQSLRNLHRRFPLTALTRRFLEWNDYWSLVRWHEGWDQT